MTETQNPGEKTLTVTPTKTLTLKRSVEQGVVRQSFSHGRTKQVVVEKVRRRSVGPGDGKGTETAPTSAPAVSAPRRGASSGRGGAGPANRGGARPGGGRETGGGGGEPNQGEGTGRPPAARGDRKSGRKERA